MPKTEQRGAQMKSITSMDASGGVQNKTVPAMSRSNEFLHMLNADIDKRTGGLVGRHGSVVKNEPGKVVVKIGVYRNGPTTRKYFIIASDGSNEVIYTVPNSDFSGTLTAVLAAHFTDGENVHSATFATKEMFFNGQDTPKQTLDFSSFSDITNAPAAGKFPAVFQQRLYVLSTDGFLHYSDVINSTGDDFSTTTWSNRGINPNDGQEPKALRRHRSRLVIFKTESIYRYDGSNEPEAIINVGTHSERGVVQTDTLLYFHHHTEIYKMNLGDPIIISRPVEKYLKGVPSANWKNVAMGKDASNIYCWLGDVTINDPLAWDYQETYENVVLVYNFLLERWMVWTGWDAREFLQDTDNAAQYFYDVSGNISYIDPTRYNDNDVPIDFQVMWQPLSYGVPQLKKNIDRIMIDGTPDLKLRAGATPATMKAEGRVYEDSKTIQIKQRISFYKLWISANVAYTKIPPYIEQLYIGDAYVGNKP